IPPDPSRRRPSWPRRSGRRLAYALRSSARRARSRNGSPVTSASRAAGRGSRSGRKGCVMRGTIKKLGADKGFGFIKGERGEVFFHRWSVDGDGFSRLQEGQDVEYTEGQGPKGPRAENVKPV